MSKVTKYLLSPTHPYGRHKARVLRSLGFRLEEPSALVSALLKVGQGGILVETEETAFGTKHVVVGTLVGPVGSMVARTVWMTSVGSEEPTLVTVYRRR